MSGDERFDGMFMTVAQQAGGIEPLFDSFFGFLCRKTDFYSGCKAKVDAEKTVSKSLDKFYVISQEKIQKDKEDSRKRDEERKLRQAEQKKSDEEEYAKRIKSQQGSSGTTIEEVSDDVPVGIVQEEEKDRLLPKKEEAIVAPAAELKGDDDDEEGSKEPPPVGNGGQNDKYAWTQTLGTCDCHLGVRPGVNSRDISVEIKQESVKVFYKNDPKNPILSGKLYGRIKVEDSTWTLVDSKTVHLSFEKCDQMKWWATVVQGDPEIDTKKIVPENSKLSELDGETRQTVEKMMHDQKMKQLGLPTSDQQKQHDILEKFKSAHPEMDFSKCKVNYGSESGMGAGGGMPFGGGSIGGS